MAAPPPPPPAPKAMNVLIDRSGSNSKCVAVSEPVTCDVDAGNLGKRINSHRARDTFEITTNGAQVCARRTDSPGNGWGMRLEVACRTGGVVAAPPPPPPAPKAMNVLIDRSGSNSKCVAVSEPVTCDVDAGNLGKRINSHRARDTFEITTNGAQVCARRTDSPGNGWGMRLEVACRTGGGTSSSCCCPLQEDEAWPNDHQELPWKEN